MKPILLLYSTNSGSTFTTGQLIKDVLADKFEVSLQNATEFKPEDIKKFDIVILGSPSWYSRGKEGMPTETMLKLLDAWKDQQFSKKKFAVYGCGDDGFATFCGAVKYLEDFVNSTNGQFILPSLRLNSFWFDIDRNVESAKKWAKDLKVKLLV